jgi:hypothetical protein
MSRLKPDQLLQILYGSAQEVTETRGQQKDTKITRYRDGEGNWRVRKTYSPFLEHMQDRELEILQKIGVELEGLELQHTASATLPTIDPATWDRGIDLAWYGFDLEDWLRMFSARDAQNLAQWRNAGFLLQLLRAALLSLRGLHMLQIVHCNIRTDKLCLVGRFHKEAKMVGLAPDSLVLIGMGIAVVKQDFSRLLKLDFRNEFDGQPAYWKSRALREAHAKLAAGRMDGVHFSCAMDYASLGRVIERHLQELARQAGQGDWQSLPAGDPAQVACLGQIVREMTDEDKPVSEPLRWLGAIDAALGKTPRERAWLLRLTPNHESQTLPPSYEDGRASLFVIPPRFERAEWFATNGLAAVMVNDKYGYINTRGEEVIPLRFSYAEDFAANGLAIVKRDADCKEEIRGFALRIAGWGGYAGCVNAKGEEVVPLRFKVIGRFAANGLALVELNGKYGYVNEKGEEVIPLRFDGASDFAANGLALFQADGKYGYINEKGEEVIKPRFSKADDFVNGLALFKVDDKYGYINEMGEEITLSRFDKASRFAANGLARVMVHDEQRHTIKNGYINAKGEEVIPLRFNETCDFAHGLAAAEVDGCYGYIDEKGEWIIKPRFYKARDFAADGLAVIMAREKMGIRSGYIDRSGEFVIEPRFHDARDFAANGLAVISVFTRREDGRSSSLSGYIDRSGEFVIEPRFDWADDFDHKLARVKLGGHHTCINEKGEAVIPSFRKFVTGAFAHGLVPVFAGKWGYIKIPEN